MKIIVLIIITLLLIILLTQKIKFGNILNSDLSIRVTSQTINNIQFTLSYTTPAFYTQSPVTDLKATNLQKVFKDRPLLFLVDTSQLTGADAAAKGTILNGFPNFTSMKLTNLLNNPDSQTTSPAVSPTIDKFVSGSAGDPLDSDILNLINVSNLQTSTNVSIIGNSNLINQAVTCTIAPSVDIVTTPLVIGRTYALGLALMNGVQLFRSGTPTTWHGLGVSPILTMYSQLVWYGFTITNSMIIDNIMNVAIEYGILSNDYSVASS